MTIKESLATGRRKTAIASVRLRPGSGNVIVNKHNGLDYFKTTVQRENVLFPLALVEMQGQYDILVRVRGGGLDSQSTAVRLAISRALLKENEELKSKLREAGFLTRDPRRRERKKYGQPGARKRFQFSKR